MAAYVEQFADQVDEDGRRLVVRNGYHQPRTVVTSAGAVEVKAPRVNDKRTDPETGERQRFSSAILPAWARRSPQITEVLLLLYLHGLSSGDFAPALEQFLGTGAGLSASSITRLTTQWQDEARAFAARDLSGVDYVYLWVDGIHLEIRLEQEKLCLLVMIGVRADGRKEQRCWFHKQANTLAALPKSAHPGAQAAMKEIYNAEDADVLLEFYHYPAEHWIHLRTTNPIESTFATVRLRSKVTKGPGSRARARDGVQADRGR